MWVCEVSSFEEFSFTHLTLHNHHSHYQQHQHQQQQEEEEEGEQNELDRETDQPQQEEQAFQQQQQQQHEKRRRLLVGHGKDTPHYMTESISLMERSRRGSRSVADLACASTVGGGTAVRSVAERG